MSVLDEVRDQVGEIVAERGLQDHRSFGYWFLESMELISKEEAIDLVTDGAWDEGRDAVYRDDFARELRIYQFKYSEDKAYVLNAFTDIQRGLIYEAGNGNLAGIDKVTCYVITILSADDDIVQAARAAQKRIRGWLTRHDYTGIEASVEVWDLRKFAQLFEKLYGVDLAIDFKVPPIVDGDGLLGLIDAGALREHVTQDELFAFNIRTFLGKRKGSVNAEINESLEDDSERDRFWHLNNGIVCLCTSIESESDTRYRFVNFTVVNGAQTTSTIAAYLERNPTDDQRVWVVGKVLRVDETDIDRAGQLTKTSNLQTPASNKDIRAVDVTHRRIADWLVQRGLVYVYRRGLGSPRGPQAVEMKDLAQAFVAFSMKEPHVPFARVGTIFSNDDYYNAVYNQEWVETLWRIGTPEDVNRDYLDERLLAVRLAQGVRSYIDAAIKDGDGRQWRSLTYHVVWLYRRLFDGMGITDWAPVLANVDAIVAATVKDLYDGAKTFASYSGLVIPRDLKSTAFADKAESLVENERAKAVKSIAAILSATPPIAAPAIAEAEEG